MQIGGLARGVNACDGALRFPPVNMFPGSIMILTKIKAVNEEEKIICPESLRPSLPSKVNKEHATDQYLSF